MPITTWSVRTFVLHPRLGVEGSLLASLASRAQHERPFFRLTGHGSLSIIPRADDPVSKCDWQPFEIMNIPSFIIPVDEIPEPGKLFQEQIPGDWLAASLLAPYKPASDLEIALELQKVQDNVLVQGTLRMALSFFCSRTGDAGLMEMTLRLSELFQPASSHTIKLADGVESDDLEGDEPYTYEGRKLDLEPLIREQIVLAQDPYPSVVEGPDPDDDTVAWSSKSNEIDPRWQKLKDFNIN